MNSVIFNDLNLSDYCIIKSIKESILPPISTTRKAIPGRRGTKYIRKELGEKIIEIDVEIPAVGFGDRQSTIDEITPKLYTQDEKELILRGNRKYYASLDSETLLENLVFHGATTLVFLATDPLAYGDTKTIDITSAPTVINGGTYPAAGTITVEITEPISNIDITLQNTGEYIFVAHNFVIGDIVRVDLGEEMVYKNGYSIMQDCYLESDFFEIPVGEFEISVSSGNATLEFTERWL